MKKLMVAALATCGAGYLMLTASAGVGEMATKPIWDLADHGGAVAVSAAKPFEIPPSAFTDSYAFTIELTYRFDDLTEDRYFTLVDQEVGETGFRLEATTIAGRGKACNLRMNGQQYGCGPWFWQVEAGATMTLTVTARGGWVVVYRNGYVLRSYMAKITPNLNPIRIGGPSSAPRKNPELDLKNVTLLSAKVWDGTEEYYAKDEPKKRARGEMCGKGWMMSVPTEPDPSIPNLFYYGASGTVGFTPGLQSRAKGKANLYHRMGFIYFPGEKGVPVDTFADIGKHVNIDYVYFENGGHASHWTKEKVSDEDIRVSYETLVKAVRQMAPKAKKMVFGLNGPRMKMKKGTEAANAKLLKENVTIERQNAIAREVMAKAGIPVLDFYTDYKDRPEVSSGDGYHFNAAAYDKVAEAIWNALDIGQGGCGR